MKHKGVLVVVSGFSGAGKGTVMKELLDNYSEYALSISHTTRNPREGEKDGVHYFFKSKEIFEAGIKEDKYLEYASYVDNYYGTPRDYVMQQLQDGKDVLLEIEVQGALQVKKRFPEAILVFITPPSAEELKARLVNRGTESSQVIASRLSRANEEAESMGEYDYILVNDQLEVCVEQLHQLIQSMHCKSIENQGLIEDIKKQLKVFAKGD
ncbi:MAG TPA: guanylate kinase [Lachnospiraceae bacterium]